MNEIEVAGHTYAVGRLDSFKQFHVARRIAPVQIAAGISFSELAKAMMVPGEEEKDVSEEAMAKAFLPVIELVSKLPDADVDYVLKVCLGVVKRKEGERYAPLYAGDTLMYQDLSMPSMIRLVMEVIKVNVGDFFGPLLGAKPSGEA